jgi:predicted CopG family antitoxin
MIGSHVAYSDVCRELLALRKQTALDRQSRESSQAEYARLNRELNEAKDTARKISEAHGELFSLLVEERSRIGVLLDEIASAAIAAGMMDPARRGLLDGPNAIQFLRQMKEEFERNQA